jgi:hypothetical protein
VHYDASPNIIIIPAMTLEEAKDWKREGYSATVVCTDDANAAEHYHDHISNWGRETDTDECQCKTGCNQRWLEAAVDLISSLVTRLVRSMIVEHQTDKVLSDHHKPPERALESASQNSRGSEISLKSEGSGSTGGSNKPLIHGKRKKAVDMSMSTEESKTVDGETTRKAQETASVILFKSAASALRCAPVHVSRFQKLRC